MGRSELESGVEVVNATQKHHIPAYHWFDQGSARNGDGEAAEWHAGSSACGRDIVAAVWRKPHVHGRSACGNQHAPAQPKAGARHRIAPQPVAVQVAGSLVRVADRYRL